VSVFDPAMGNQVSLSADRVVLSAGIEPRDNRDLAKLLRIEVNCDGFFQEANPKSAPLDSVDRGKFFCGLCHSPNLMEDAISQGTRRRPGRRRFFPKRRPRRRPISPM